MPVLFTWNSFYFLLQLKNDLALLYYKMIFELLAIDLPYVFELISWNQLRYARTTSEIIVKRDRTQIKCTINQIMKTLGILSSLEPWLSGIKLQYATST